MNRKEAILSIIPGGSLFILNNEPGQKPNAFQEKALTGQTGTLLLLELLVISSACYAASVSKESHISYSLLIGMGTYLAGKLALTGLAYHLRPPTLE